MSTTPSITDSQTEAAGASSSTRWFSRSSSIRPSTICTTRWHWSAMRGSWVTITIVSPRACISWKICRISRPVLLSRLPVGSSARISDGPFTRRGRWPRAGAGRRTARRAGACARSPRPTRSSAPARALAPLGAAHARVEQGQLHVAQQRGLGQQVEGLEHEADLPVPHARRAGSPTSPTRPGRRARSCPSVGRVQAAQDVHQGRLARAGGADDRDHLALLDRRGRCRAGPAPPARPRRRSW